MRIMPDLHIRFLDASVPPSWLEELRQFRARVLWEDGRRPEFRDAGDRFVDADPHDLTAYHFIMRDQSDRMVGCLRLALLERILATSQSLYIDPCTGELTMERYGCSPGQVYELGRFVMDPAWQRKGLGGVLLRAAAALGHETERRLIWAIAGTRDGQERVFRRCGWERVTEKPTTIPRYDDEVHLVATSTRPRHQI
ncbi:GNAT family N-acetyltransferase [Streptomyces sp. DT24]|uniref:GNAT family N-acetyltransferase n=1 Tax=unclassified Streptomyces TaxID=2593676 RepID=UPI0023B9CB3E|nr:GNAT family N-acetyltransferase [Streptomyces sp. AM 4-1-1]WEH35553.1 GNAT family N-acetyltransferase [Streptomyces sp. AM 4-1-1]